MGGGSQNRFHDVFEFTYPTLHRSPLPEKVQKIKARYLLLSPVGDEKEADRVQRMKNSDVDFEKRLK